MSKSSRLQAFSFSHILTGVSAAALLLVVFAGSALAQTDLNGENKTITPATGADWSTRTINKDLRANRHFTNIENSNLRKEGRTNPKIQIFNQRYVNKFDYSTKKSQKYDNVFSSYNNENMKFQPISNHISVESTNYDKDSEKKGEQRSKNCKK